MPFPADLNPDRLLERAIDFGVRAVITSCEELFVEGASALDTPLCQAAAVAVVRNPWLATGADADLGPATARLAPILAALLSTRLLDTLGGSATIAAFGKAALVGIDGELEHAGALIHSPYFGNLVREFLDGTSVICFTDGRAAAGGQVRVPMWHKTTATSRDHYQAIDVHLPAAPNPDEICVIAAAATGPRPHPRIGDRTTDPAISSDILKGLLA